MYLFCGIFSKGQIFHNCFAILVRSDLCHHIPFRILFVAFSGTVHLEISCINILRCDDLKLRTRKRLHFILEFAVIAFQHLALFLDRQFPFYRMVVIVHGDHRIPTGGIHQKCGIAVHFYFIVVLIQRITVRRIYFFNPVMAEFQIVRKDQIALLIRKIRFMGNNCWIGCYLLHIFSGIQIEHLKFCTRFQDASMSLIILLCNFQLCFKFFIQKYTPYLRLIRMIFRDLHNKIVNRLIVVGCCCLPHHVGSVWNRNRAGISLFICEDFCCAILSDHNRSG